MEYEFLESSEMFMPVFGQDDFNFSLFQAEEKSENIDNNVLVEKFADYGDSTAAEIGPNFEDSESLFDNEWMTTKIDLGCLPDQPHNNFILPSNDAHLHSTIPSVSVETQLEVPSLLSALLGSKATNAETSNPVHTDSGCVEESSLDDVAPVSPEQSVPDINGMNGEQFKALLDSFLSAARSDQEDSFEKDIFILETPPTTDLPAKRKNDDPTPQGPKAKVKTPEQKHRKRMQNRNAATRYRSKKRGEQENLNAKCEQLEGENVELRKKIESKTQEIQYLKNLIIDVFSKKHAKN
ncbi:cyclic AMP-dependent transcription factor ATF-4-like [Dendronephthya gigantea]|uniref:cyclic AMP-dependent transcription factor ATF-4-like n=1 Tax=Dendronephthya gigantea TaxID=151771 RepID=UPI001068D482|nr:cyclic AMP-dependent transcription factor ATF-4-like [Dendronephthya gigantea]